MHIDTKALFERELRIAFPEKITLCGQEFEQVDVFKAASPLTFLEAYFEWLRLGIADGRFHSTDGGNTFVGGNVSNTVPINHTLALIRPLNHV